MTRDLFNADHGAGKGDKPRSKLDANWARRFSEIKWPVYHVSGFLRKSNRQVKVYSNEKGQ